MGRTLMASRVQNLGEQVNSLRIAAVENKWIFTAGMLRVVEEGLLITYNMLSGTDTSEGEL